MHLQCTILCQLHLHTNCSHIHIILRPQILWFQSLSHQGLQDPVQFAETTIGRALTHALPGCYASFVSGIVDCAVVFACARKNALNADLLLLKIYFLFSNSVTNYISFKFLVATCVNVLRTILGGAIASIIVFVFLYDNGPNNTIL